MWEFAPPRLCLCVFYLKSFIHPSADDQQIYSFLQHLLQVGGLDSRGMLGAGERCVLSTVGHQHATCILWTFRLRFHSRWSRSPSSPRPDCLRARPYSPCSWRSIPSPRCGPRRERRSLERTCHLRPPTGRQGRPGGRRWVCTGQ